MKYFVSEEERKASHSTCYFEFQEGYYHDKCWLPNSISMKCELWDEYKLSKLINDVVEKFDYYGITVVTKEQWEVIVNHSQVYGITKQDILLKNDF